MAYELVTNAAYRRELKRRLLAGEAGPLEGLLWRYAFGDPPKAEQTDDVRVHVVYEGSAGVLSVPPPCGSVAEWQTRFPPDDAPRGEDDPHNEAS